ncbi:hypothetical protein PHLGIDRAFT_72685 [Phlebiopsis gigantea 11061_1 CR5-6]|uniref:Alpha/beta hydrolase fold-3 domain-containing protein n=1 Tax=Phlebiopsis gigantea (strain 11061_1 CR5-6) TaxID=745531 RepID=A0A0C3S9S0_PHLG1|nr:hypothetical protein PHLGIDRAFT_72685 [Phlebiopsis gigantea 11061_1 CR5-6]
MALFQTLLAILETFTVIFVRLPLVLLYSVPRRNRPRPTWTIRRVLWLHVLKNGYLHRLAGKNPDHTAITGGPGVKGVWVAPTPHLIQGEVKEWAELAGVESVSIPGYWMDKQGSDIPACAPPAEGEIVLMHLHGGAYTALSAHPSSAPSAIPRGILKHVKAIKRTFNLEYRLTKPPATTPENPFPAALLDAIAGYSYLVNEVGFAPENIVVEGDSAGGNLALALVRYLVEQQGKGDALLPRPPSALLLLSPWSDLSIRGHNPDSSVYTCLPTDFVDTTTADYAAITLQYLGPLGRRGADTNRYVSPGSDSPHVGEISFAGFPRTLIFAGGAEALRDQIRTLRAKMTADLGESVEYHEFPDAIHDFIAMPIIEPERSQALEIIAKWVDAA